MHGNNMGTLFRSFAVVALVSALLVPSIFAQAQGTPGVGGTDTQVESGGGSGITDTAGNMLESPSPGGKSWFESWIWDPLLNLLGTSLMTLSAVVLTIAGKAFDTFLKLMILDFRTTFDGTIKGIQIGWQLFRDLANLAIIGIFVFVAVMTILGKTEFGAKKLIARVLIVAVLINFSLLFTNIAIETTNFLSTKFWQAMSPQIKDQGTAQTFLKAFGIENYWSDSSKLVSGVTTNTGSGLTGFMYGVVGAIAFLMISYVLLYGAFVITARALLLIFALLTSSIAFASIMLPDHLAKTSYVGWYAWKSNLIKAAMFGPLLILFLWITMKIIQEANPNGAGRALSTLAHTPEKVTPEAWQQIIILMIGTGILYIAIRSAGSFANSIAGYSDLKFGLGASLAYGSRGLGVVGRNTVGRYATWRDPKNEQALLLAKSRLANLENQGIKGFQRWQAQSEVSRLERTKRNSARLAGGSFNALNYDVTKKLVKNLGAQGALGEKNKSFEARLKETSKEAAKKALTETVSKKDAMKSAEELTRQQKDMLKQQKEGAQKVVEEIRKSTVQSASAQKASEQHAAAAERAEKVRSDAERQKIDVDREHSSGNIDKQKRDELIRAQDNRIEKANEEVQTTLKAMESINQPLRDATAKYEKIAEQHESYDVTKEAEKIASRVLENNVEAMKEKAAKYASWPGTRNGLFAQAARAQVKEQKAKKESDDKSSKAFKNTLKEMLKDVEKEK